MAPFKRARQPKMTTQALLDFDLGESSSDDSDFRIPDRDDEDDDDENSSEDDEDDDGEEEVDSDSDSEAEVSGDDALKELVKTEDMDLGAEAQPQANGGDDLEAMLKELDSKKQQMPKLPTKPICCVCLGDRSDEINEIIECDGCGVSVHEGCYGVTDNVSISSTNSTCSTEPWFCEACRAGVSEPLCELCPNKGGIYKETDVGRWVHLVCALYVPGVAFGEVDQLSSVTLFEMQYSKWGAKVCALCESSRFARVGVCIGCDAGMCKTYFHVTCAQAAGFLTEAHHEEAEAADPFYAHCKLHSEKELLKKRKRNFHTFRLNMQQKLKDKLALKLEDSCPAQMRIQRKLLKYQRKYSSHKQLRANPWVPTQKMSRLLTTSASACKRLLAKAEIMAVDVELLERQEAQIAALTDIRKKWHIAPAFSVEFIGYYLDRISRSTELKTQLATMMDSNSCLSKEQDSLRIDYDAQLDNNKELKSKQEMLLASIELLHKELTTLCPSKSLPSAAHIGRAQQEPPKTSTPPTRPISVPTAAALKMGVGFPLAHLGPPGTKVDSTRLLSTHAKNSPNAAPGTSSAPTTPTLGVQNFDCGICKRCTDQHLLAKCDTCQLHYHLGCLNPPLTRHPKKSKLYGWQCSECDKSDESESVPELPKGPRKSRTRFNKDGLIVPVKRPECSLSPPEPPAVPAKRRSTDTALPRQPNAAKKAHKALPIAAAFDAALAAASTPKTPTTGLIKRSRLSSYTPPQSIAEKPVSPTKLTPPTNNKGKTCFTASTPLPVQVLLPPDEPVLMVISQGSTPRPSDGAAAANDGDPLALPTHAPSNTTISSLDDSSDPNKQARKQKRKDKHKNKHNLSSDTEKSLNREHKRKRKKKVHHEHSVEAGGMGGLTESPGGAGGTHKIKIKFKTLPLPGEVTPEAQFFYVSADMVRSAEEASRPTSVETVEDASFAQSAPAVVNAASPALGSVATVAQVKPVTPITPTPTAVTPFTTPPARKVSPRKAQQLSGSGGRQKSAAAAQAVAPSLQCCVCQQPGVAANVVTCDECRKHYHFTCLDPPLKKTPKIRGYSWHCADCDPTDDERK